MRHFGDLRQVFSASYRRLEAFPGLGEGSAVLLKLVGHWFNADLPANIPSAAPETARQAALFEAPPEPEPLPDAAPQPQKPLMRAYDNDEIANALTFIPLAAQFETFEAFRKELQDRLPYNSASTRQRRARYILKRFYPAGRLDTPLSYYASHCAAKADLKPVLFYHILKAEPLAAKVAAEFIWPALPLGHVGREDMRQFILRYLPNSSAASQTKILRALFNTYNLLSIGVENEAALQVQTRAGTLKAFLYILTAECPQPGIYSYDILDQGPLRQWLLWDREWMRRQLYNLRDFGIISKISEIDTVRQFTLQGDHINALRRYFEHPERKTMALREHL